ncbi:peptidylprolyl isomerase [Micromonospora fluostatini]|uniref:peptidylprolyl isomerase n=1 Tax=Micromonospora sp. JCM 30529 TaxID=3421643 RepID=UPI003D180B8C
MASSRDRQRKLARAKLDRQQARRAAATKRRRQIQAAVGAAVVVLLIVVGSAWALGAFESDPEETTAANNEVCAWTPQDGGGNNSLKDVGTPTTVGLPTEGTRPMTVTTNQGAVTAELDLALAPCSAASLEHLAGRAFYDNTNCHEITAEGAVRCGDPSGTGLGGPTYSFSDENVPIPAPDPSASPAPEREPAYPKGTVAMVGSAPGVNGSQFLIFFKDFDPAEPAYPVVGRVTEGLDVVEKIGALPTVDNGNGDKVKPETDVVIRTLTVGASANAPAPTEPAPSPSAG